MNIFKKQNSLHIALTCSVSFFLVYYVLAKLVLIITLEVSMEQSIQVEQEAKLIQKMDFLLVLEAIIKLV